MKDLWWINFKKINRHYLNKTPTGFDSTRNDHSVSCTRKLKKKTSAPESLINKVAGLRLATLLKKRPWHRCCEILKNTFFTKHLQWLFWNALVKMYAHTLSSRWMFCLWHLAELDLLILFRLDSDLYWHLFGLNTERYSMREKTDQKNSEYQKNSKYGHFSRSGFLWFSFVGRNWLVYYKIVIYWRGTQWINCTAYLTFCTGRLN